VAAKWEFSVLDQRIEIEYDSDDWTTDYMSKNKLQHYTIQPLEKVTFGKIYGKRELVENLIIPLIYVEQKNYSQVHKAIVFIFNYYD